MRRRPQSCTWCGREVPDAEIGRRRRYCRQSCRQRAYEHRSAIRGSSVPEDSTVLSVQESIELVDRAYAARCAAEDVATAVREGADRPELERMCEELVRLARDAERLR